MAKTSDVTKRQQCPFTASQERDVQVLNLTTAAEMSLHGTSLHDCADVSWRDTPFVRSCGKTMWKTASPLNEFVLKKYSLSYYHDT